MTTTTIRRGALGAATSLILALAGCAETGGGDAGAVAIGTLACGGSANGYAFEYQVVEYSNGDVWTSCSVDDGYAESGESSFWFAGTNGAASGGCNVTMDVSGENTGGWWSFEMTATGGIATYHDAGDVADGDTVTLGADVCEYFEPT
jgi:hypothetical protein